MVTAMPGLITRTVRAPDSTRAFSVRASSATWPTVQLRDSALQLMAGSCSARPGSFRAGGGSGSLAKGPSSAWVGLPPLAQAARASSSIGTVRRGILDMGGSLGGAGSLAQPEAGLPAGGRLETEQQRYVTEHPLCCGGE